MKRATVVVNWNEGLHLRHAARLVRAAQTFRSTIVLKCCGRIADLHSILSVIALCATMGAAIEIEANGDDEQEAANTIEQVFVSAANDTCAELS